MLKALKSISWKDYVIGFFYLTGIVLIITFNVLFASHQVEVGMTLSAAGAQAFIEYFPYLISGLMSFVFGTMVMEYA